MSFALDTTFGKNLMVDGLVSSNIYNHQGIGCKHPPPAV
jgi:hypothetical protein